MNTYQVNHHYLLKRLNYQEATVLGINGRTEAETIVIYQGFIANLVSAHYIIELLLNLNY